VSPPRLLAGLMDNNPGRSAFSRLLLVFDVALSTRAVYGFLKAYFRWRLTRSKDGGAALTASAPAEPRKKVRIYLDGCFDLMHYGHANAIRQAASLGDELIVGVCSDEEITKHKGPPVMTEEERYETVEAVKWVDHVIRGVPYNVTPEFLETLVRDYDIDYVVHGDDPCLDASGRDVYEAVKQAGKFRTIARTEGVSSTDALLKTSKMKCLLLFAVFGLACGRDLGLEEAHREWQQFKTNHKKVYGSEHEESRRFQIFHNNLRSIEEHNQRYSNGEISYRLGVNHLTDMLPEEVNTLLNGYNATIKMESKSRRVFEKLGSKLPPFVDWRTKGAVTPVKDQAKCGSCWSFSTTGSLEGQHFLKTGHLVSLSEQNLMDCSVPYGNHGCNGGDMDPALQYVTDNNGISTEAAYPYEAKDGECRYSSAFKGATAQGFVDVQPGDEEALQEALATIGPISVAIDASKKTFHAYAGGVYYEPDCVTRDLDHAVLAVGYGTENGLDYWLVKNSWGEVWGESGYIKMARNRNNNCGIASSATYPLV